jgi:hypothetical protein
VQLPGSRLPKDDVRLVCVTLAPVPMTEEQRAAAWDEISDNLSGLLQGEGDIPAGAVPFDAASSIAMDQQR